MPDAEGEEDHLKSEWTEANRKRSALQTELHKPTVSRLLEAQTKLVNELEAARDNCRSPKVALGAHRKTRVHTA